MRSLSVFLRYRGQMLVGCVALLATNAFALAIPWALGRAVDAFQGDNPARDLPMLALLMVGLAIAQAITRIASRIVLFNAARRAEYDLKSKVFAHLLTLDPAFFRKHSIGDISSRLTNDVQTLRTMWGPGTLTLVNTAVLFAVAITLMVRLNPWLTLWALVPFPCMVVFGMYFSRFLVRTNRAVSAQLGALSAVVQEDLVGIGIVKSYSLERDRLERFGDASQTLLKRAVAATWIRGLLPPVLSILASAGTVVALWIGGSSVIDGRMGLGQLVQFNGYLVLLVSPTVSFGYLLNLIQRGRVSWQRVTDLLDARPRIVDGEDTSIDPTSVSGDISIRNLTVEIDGHKLLDDVSLEIPAGTMTAVVGRVGSGKSTLAEALPRLLDVPKQSVFLDGRDVTDMPLATLRRCIGYSPQDAFLFSTTIAENIAFGHDRTTKRNGDPTARTGKITDAARAAGLANDIAILPEGYDTIAGERGITLSGGQRQRVALARAIAAEPRVLVLDDSLSSVDAETEREILGHLREVMVGRTSIVISHRVAAVRHADQIVVLDQGRVTEVGTHASLVEANGTYAELYRTQLSKEPQL